MWALALSLVLVTQQAAPPTAAQIQKWFEAGQYEQVVDSQQSDPMALYFIGLSYERLDRLDDAHRVYQQLAARGETDPWTLIARAATVLATESAGEVTPEALADADVAIQEAVTTAPSLAAAHYQRGLVEAYQGDHTAAAAAFEEATMLAPTFAYAHYYGGLSYSRIDRADQMAIHFERFLRLAPQAPEADRVESLMRSVRGR